MIRLPMVLLFLMACWTIVPASALATSNVDAAPLPNDSFAKLLEVAAALDSKGRVHAAWIEQNDESSEQSSVRLLYSTYDPETTRAKGAHLLDTSSFIYSLSMTIDELDRAHIVWTSESVQTANLQGETDQKSANRVYYIEMTAGEATSSSPKLLVDSRAEALWTAIVLGRESQLYLVWTEVDRRSPTDFESLGYYARLDMHDVGSNLTRNQFASRTGSSRLLKATSSADRTGLHLAWIEEAFENRSRIMYSKMDPLQGTALIKDLEDVDGRVSRLALARAKDGEVVVGWTCREAARNEQTASLARLSDQGDIMRMETGLRSDRAAEPESVTVDSEGNLHLLWMDYGDSIQRGPKPLRGPQPTYYHVKLSSDGQSREQEELISNFATKAAFLVDNGRIYAVSQWGLLEVTKPVSTYTSTVFLLALFAFASALGAASTEAGTYVLTRWAATLPLGRTLIQSGPLDLEPRLLRRMKRRPGATLSELRSAAQRNIFSIASHLRLLESSGVVRSLREGTRQRFYCLISDDQKETHAHELRRSVLLLVRTEPGITEAQIARRLGISQQLTNYHLRLLSKSRLLSSIRTSGRVSYFVNQRMLPRLKETGEAAQCSETLT